jgi:hypothetical protein
MGQRPGANRSFTPMWSILTSIALRCDIKGGSPRRDRLRSVNESSRCKIPNPNRQNLFKIVSHLLLGRSGKKPLSFHLVKRKMTCFGEQGSPTPHLISPIGRLLVCCRENKASSEPQFVNFSGRCSVLLRCRDAAHGRLSPSPPRNGMYR